MSGLRKVGMVRSDVSTMVWYGTVMVWYGMVWSMVWYGAVWYGKVRCGRGLHEEAESRAVRHGRWLRKR